MNPAMIREVQDSWALVRPRADEAGALFYRHLFAADPALQPLFRGDMAAQARRLVKMIDAAVAGLHDLQALAPVLQGLGARHRGYGVQPAHYATVGSALLLTLEQGLGEAFTPARRQAWTAVYAALAAAMQAEPAVA